MHHIVVIATDGVIAADITAPCEVFGRTRGPDGKSLYQVTVCAPTLKVDAGIFRVECDAGLEALHSADTVVIPGNIDMHKPPTEEVCEAILGAHTRGARVVSICTGAFMLAATGLLRGLRVTTHWAAADLLAQQFPELEVDPSVLYVDHGRILTSAGAAAGLDLCLHLVRRDFGVQVAAQCARFVVMPLEREGGQAQFIEHALPSAEDSLQPLLQWIEGHLSHDLSVVALARRAAMSPRHFARRFVEQTSITPARWVQLARVRRAQQLLEATDWSIEQVAEGAGFGAATTLRDGFRRVVGTSPSRYRRAFQARDQTLTSY